MNGIQKHSFVRKRDGRLEELKLDKIRTRIGNLCDGLNMDYINPHLITIKIVSGIYDNITTSELDKYAANYISNLTVDHPDYGLLAGRIAASNLQKTTCKTFSEAISKLHKNFDEKLGRSYPMISDNIHEIVMRNKERLDAAIEPKRDLDFNYFGIHTLEQVYLMRCNGIVVETPQYMFMRVAICVHENDIDAAIETYNLMSNRYFTHATPTLFNAGRPRPHLSSCYLLNITEDSIDGIFKTLHRCSVILKCGGGIGLSLHNIRALGSSLEGIPEKASGLLPMLKVYNATANYVDQGGKRPGSIALYLEPWHADIFDFIELRLNIGPEEARCRDLFLALWIPDLFMRRVEADSDWCLMSPDECKGLSDCFGDEFDRLYEKYEAEGRFRKKIKARKLWKTIVNSQCETGLPYMLYKDACNKKSNQQNLGIIKSSNLCTEIIEYTDANEVAVCNLASIALNRFVKNDSSYDFESLRKVSKIIARNLNKVIDANFYPVEEARISNMRHRPIGIGVQGLADVFMLMRLPFTSLEARNLNKKIFETIYFGALEASCELAEQFGPYETYKGSPISKGQLQFDLWDGVKLSDELNWDWNGLKKRILKYGVRNSLLVAPMPTASTAQILGNNEAFEPYTSNIYTRRTSRGDFQVVNKHLIYDLIKHGLWNIDTRDAIITANGSVQSLDIPNDLKELYKTVWELKQIKLIQMAADRGPFIDQSQSLSLFLESPNLPKCSTLHFHAWKLGLKTGMYYLRSKPSVNPVKFTVKRKFIASVTDKEINSDGLIEKHEVCEMCSS